MASIRSDSLAKSKFALAESRHAQFRSFVKPITKKKSTFPNTTRAFSKYSHILISILATVVQIC